MVQPGDRHVPTRTGNSWVRDADQNDLVSLERNIPAGSVVAGEAEEFFPGPVERSVQRTVIVEPDYPRTLKWLKRLGRRGLFCLSSIAMPKRSLVAVAEVEDQLSGTVE